MLSLIIKGGPIMAPIILLSIVALAIIIERILALAAIRLNIPQFAGEIIALVQKGLYYKALARCREVKHPVGKVFAEGIAKRGRKREETEQMMEREGDERVRQMEKGLAVLIVIIGVEPMLGFLGTIFGLIKAFMSWERLGTSITVSALAAGIYQAMITTAGGLLVAIPAFIVYHLFTATIRRQANEMSYWGNELLDTLNGVRRESVL